MPVSTVVSDPLSCVEVSFHPVVEIIGVSGNLGENLNLVSSSSSSLLSSRNNISDSCPSSLSSPSSSTSSSSVSCSACSPVSFVTGTPHGVTLPTDRNGSDGKNCLIVKVEQSNDATQTAKVQPDSSNIEDLNEDELETVLNFGGDNKNDACELELDFDDVDLDEDDITSGESSCVCGDHYNSPNSCSSNYDSVTSASSIGKSHHSVGKIKKRTPEDDDDQCSDDGETENDDSNDQYLGIENPNAVPCLHCQGGKDHPNKENLIWPIQLDLDLIETLFHLCPTFFDDFDEVEMDPMDLGSTLPNIDLTGSRENKQSLDTSSTSYTSQNSSVSSVSQPSPPNVQVDDSPLQPSMDRNKESLKVKLLLRRPMNQLVEQGILPPPKTPAAFAGQRVRLERARMGDLLKAKIQQRPARQELIRQHILEDSNARVAPSLAEKQRMLKRARLADSLNDHLIHRPGPLELVQKNILHAPDAIIEKAIKEGVVPFKATSEGHIPGPHVPNIYLGSEDDSSSDLSSPAGTPDNATGTSELSVSPPKSVDSVTGSQIISQPQNAVQIPQPSPSLGSTTSSLSPLSVASTPPPPPPLPPPPPPLPPSQVQIQNNNFQIHLQGLAKIAPSNLASTTILSHQTQNSNSSQLHFSKLMENHHQLQLQNQLNSFSTHQLQSSVQQQQHHSTSKSRSSKKSNKTKSQPKARTIKFHEYKGPPNSQKGGASNGITSVSSLSQQQSQQQVESSYELLLQQQQLFLQWQLEWQHKYPQIILPAVSKLTSPTEATGKLASAVSAAAASISMHSNPSVAAAVATAANVLTPSTVTSIVSSSERVSQSIPVSTISQKSIVPTVEKPSTIIPHLTIAPASPSQQAVLPQILTTLTVVSSSSGQTEIRPKPPPPNAIKSANINPSATKTETTGNVTVSSSSHSGRLNISKLNEWKVSELKTELKKRNLPVSGSKPQLIERLKTADSTVQDDNISTTTTLSTKNGSGVVTVIKTENIIDETSSEMMDVSGGEQQNQCDVKAENVRNSCTDSETKNNNSNSLNQTMLTLLGKGVGPLPIINALNQQQPTNFQNILISENSKIPTSTTTVNNVGSTNNNNNGGGNSFQDSPSKTSGNVIVVDETLIREQQQQIEQLQQALKMSQQQLQQMKLSQQADLKNGGGQKHRLALQQHLQWKMQQQALQQQLQKLIQLHSIQQQQQQQQAIQLAAQSHSQPQIIQQQPTKVLSTNRSQSINQTLGIEDDSDKMKNEQATVTTIPFTIVKIATTTTTHLQTVSSDQEELTNIPQIQIPDDKNSAFQIGESASGQGSKENSTADQMDHSWLLKINEAQPIDSKNGVKEFPNFFGTFVSNEDHQQKLQIKEEPKKNAAEVKSKKGFKSQMVDDVLEILIRNGELPPSAAQEPQTPTTPGKSPRIMPYPAPPTFASGGEANDSSESTPPPPPPPLPPATFAITLPTSITFSRNHSANLTNFVPLTSVTGSALNSSFTSPLLSVNINSEKSTVSSPIPKSVTNFSVHNSSTNSLSSEELSKEAQDILKISEDLSNFGREHSEQECQNQMQMQVRLFQPQNHQQLQSSLHSTHSTNMGHEDDDSNTLAMLLGEVGKDLTLVTDMDVVLEDSHHSNCSADSNRNPNQQSDLITVGFENRTPPNFMNRHNIQSFDQQTNSTISVVPMSVDSTGSHMIHIEIPNPSHNSVHSSTKMGSDDLLDELGTLLPGDLDVPMEMDYSDWLENLLPENSSNNLLVAHQNTNNNVSNNVMNVNHNNCNSNSHSFFGVNGSMMEFGNSSDQFNNSQRDPLLSSRSLDIFAANSVENNSTSGGIGMALGLGTESGLKGNGGAPSPMAMSDTLLWDFAM